MKKYSILLFLMVTIIIGVTILVTSPEFFDSEPLPTSDIRGYSIKAVQKDANTVNLFLKLREECEPKIIVEGNYIYIDLPVPQKVPAVYEEDEENSKLKINTTP